jgi:hypothetical protein
MQHVLSTGRSALRRDATALAGAMLFVAIELGTGKLGNVRTQTLRAFSAADMKNVRMLSSPYSLRNMAGGPF